MSGAATRLTRGTSAGGPAAAGPLERLFLVLALIGQQDGFFNVIRVLQGHDGALAVDVQSDPLNMVAVGLTFLGLCVLFARTPQLLPRIFAGSVLALVLCGFAAASAVWSESPAMTLKRAFVLTNGQLLAFYVASRFSFPEAIGLLGRSIAVCALASLFVCLLAPRIGVMQTFGLEGRWRGVFTHKNTLAQAMALGTILQLYALHRRGPRPLALLLLLLEAGLIVKANSATALLVILFALGVYAAFAVGVRRGPLARMFWILAPVTAGSLVVLALAFPDVLGSVSGRDASLTGRAPLWDGVRRAISDRPLLGYGYQAFWDAGDSAAAAIRETIGWDAPNSHNGVLEVLLGIGFVGGALAAAVILQAVLRAARLLVDAIRDGTAGGDPIGTAPAGLLSAVLILAVLLESQAEAVLMHQGDIDWLTLNLVSLAALRLHQIRRPAARDLGRQVLARARPRTLAPSV